MGGEPAGASGPSVMTCHVTAKARPRASARSLPVRAGAWGAVPTLPAGTEGVCRQPGLQGADTEDHTLCPQQFCYPVFETMAPFPEGFLKRVLRAVTHCGSREVAWPWGWGPRPSSQRLPSTADTRDTFPALPCNPEQLREVRLLLPHFAGRH